MTPTEQINLLRPTRYEFTSPTWCGGSLSADREEDADGEYVRLEDVQAAIDYWNQRAAPVAAIQPAGDATDTRYCAECGYHGLAHGEYSYCPTGSGTVFAPAPAAPAQPAGDADSYFNARTPLMDTAANRNIFAAGLAAGRAATAPAQHDAYLAPIKLAASVNSPGLWLDEHGSYYELAYGIDAPAQPEAKGEAIVSTVYDCDCGLIYRTHKNCSKCGTVFGITAPADGDDGLFHPPKAMLKREDWYAETRKPKLQAAQAPADKGEFLPLPDPAHRGPDGSGSYFDAFTADQVRACILADRACQAAAIAETVSVLTDADISDIADDFKSQFKHGGTTYDEFDAEGFARAIERALVAKKGG